MTGYEAFSLLIILAIACAIAAMLSPNNGRRFIRLLIEISVLLCMIAYLLRVWHIFSLPGLIQQPPQLPAFLDPSTAYDRYRWFAIINAILGFLIGIVLNETCDWPSEKLKRLSRWRRWLLFLCGVIVSGLNTVSVYLLYLDTHGAALYAINLILAIWIHHMTLFRLCALNRQPSRQ